MKLGDLVYVHSGPMWKYTGFVEALLEPGQVNHGDRVANNTVVVTLQKRFDDTGPDGHQVLLAPESLTVIGYQWEQKPVEEFDLGPN